MTILTFLDTNDIKIDHLKILVENSQTFNNIFQNLIPYFNPEKVRIPNAINMSEKD